MEGVIVGAKKSRIDDDHLGRQRRPGSATPSPATEWSRANTRSASARSGYELPVTSVDVAAQPAQLDLQLKKVTSTSKLVMQLSNGELLTSVPGTHENKVALGNCVNCHTLQKVLFSRYTAEEMVPVVQRMAMHTNNSSPLHPWTRPRASLPRAPTERQIAAAKYFSTINLSSADTFEFPLKTMPRPKGKATSGDLHHLRLAAARCSPA